MLWCVQLQILPNENKMKHPGHARQLFAAIMGAVVVVYTVFGVFGYLMYGDDARGSVTLNLTGYTVGTVV